MRLHTCVVLLTWATLTRSVAVAQETSPSAAPATAVCGFSDGRQISIHYTQDPAISRGLPINNVWTPGGSPMILFTQTALLVGGTDVPIGAYSMYIISGKRQWTLIVNKNINAGSRYDKQQDILRTPMQIGSLSQPMKQIQLVFAHIAPKQCNLRLYRAETGAWLEF